MLNSSSKPIRTVQRSYHTRYPFLCWSLPKPKEEQQTPNYGPTRQLPVLQKKMQAPKVADRS